jgi:hypothetical protein
MLGVLDSWAPEEVARGNNGAPSFIDRLDRLFSNDRTRGPVFFHGPLAFDDSRDTITAHAKVVLKFYWASDGRTRDIHGALSSTGQLYNSLLQDYGSCLSSFVVLFLDVSKVRASSSRC